MYKNNARDENKTYDSTDFVFSLGRKDPLR